MNNPTENSTKTDGPATLRCSDLLGALDSSQLDHLSLGLTHSFGATLSEKQGDDPIYLVLETGRLVALHASTITVQDVWDVAEKLSA